MSRGELAIRTEGLGKHYRIGGSREPFWALRDASFDIARGEAVGIVGRNGAGKSTLLRILSRITTPSTGRATIHGRVGSLLEVGTGFHPELTGRENVFLNGAILGMRRAEIARKFDAIVAFSGVERFLDTPVKRYSSGMRVRLAFAVAAHLEPEILIVDEVLAVGDATFQRKCLGKMSDVAGCGRTVLFVSHNLSAVRALCPHSLWLDGGRVRAEGPTAEVVERYLESGFAQADVPLSERSDREGNGALRFTRVRVLSGDPPSETRPPASGDPLRLEIAYTAPRPGKDVRVALLFLDSNGAPLFAADTRLVNADFPDLPEAGELVCELPRLPLAAGEYLVQVWGTVADEVADFVPQALRLRVSEGDFYGTGRTTQPAKHGPYVLAHSWRAVAAESQEDSAP